MADQPEPGENMDNDVKDITEEIVSDMVLKKKDLRKAEEKASEYSLKFLNSLSTPEEKLTALTKKYNTVVDELKKSHLYTKQWEKKFALMQREKDKVLAAYNKAVLLKSKLENLCRELQKQIKMVKIELQEESLLKVKKEDIRREETLSIFQKTIDQLTSAVEHNNEKNSKLMDANIDMKEKFKNVMEQYELREHHVDKMTKQMHIEAQLSEAKLAKASLEAQAEREKLLAEKKQLLIELTQYQARCNDLQAAEVVLRSQVAMYSDKYDEFQNALTKSSEVFGGFKGEMEKMSKKVEKQQKEAVIWKQRWEKSHSTLLKMMAEKQQLDSTYTLQAKQLAQLQKLCRTMQAERSILLTTLKENNIESPPLPQLPPEPEPVVNKGMDKVDVMAANCAQLKQSLSQLQGQLNDLTSKKKADTPPVIEPPVEAPQKKSKKSKNKKSKAAKGNVDSTNEVVEVEIKEVEENTVKADSNTNIDSITNGVDSTTKSEDEERLKEVVESPVISEKTEDLTNNCIVDKTDGVVIESIEIIKESATVDIGDVPVVDTIALGHESCELKLVNEPLLKIQADPL